MNSQGLVGSDRNSDGVRRIVHWILADLNNPSSILIIVPMVQIKTCREQDATRAIFVIRRLVQNIISQRTLKTPQIAFITELDLDAKAQRRRALS